MVKQWSIEIKKNIFNKKTVIKKYTAISKSIFFVQLFNKQKNI
jgi:hypothetical protein